MVDMMKTLRFILFFAGIAVVCGSCERRIGWGLLLWSNDEPPIESGTVLPVYIKSNINHVWVVGVPKKLQASAAVEKFEVPLPKLEFFRSKHAADKRAADFAPLAMMYAETLQDGLPMRDAPENNARRVYRLKQGEIVKILEKVEGTQAISASGDPLPGDWYQVLTNDGTTGYCFSYRLHLFEYAGGTMSIDKIAENNQPDLDLEIALSRTWSPEIYAGMLANNVIDLDMFSQRWGFFPDKDKGKAHIFTKDTSADVEKGKDVIIDKTLSFTSIENAGRRSWRFEGAPLQMTLRSDTTLAVQYTENGGAIKTLLFTVLPTEVDDIIKQETTRRNAMFRAIYNQGPTFSSTNYGTLAFNANGSFSWKGFDMLVPRVIPSATTGNGRAVMGLYLDTGLQSKYDGAFSLRFNGARDDTAFLYNLDNNGLRLEYVSAANIDGVLVTRRDSSPTVIFFFRGSIAETEGAE